MILWSEGKLSEVKPLRSDNTKLQATVPSDVQKSVMIVWPKKNGIVGLPIRVNVPEIWFANSENLVANTTEQEIRFFGKNLFIDGKTPTVVYIHNKKTKYAKITDMNQYQVTVKIDTKLNSGESCEFYFYNGTGGKYGWSSVFKISSTQQIMKPASELPVVNVDDFGAIADDGKDDLPAIKKALEKAAELGGAVLRFGYGEYNVSGIIEIPYTLPNGLYIEGKGMGKYDFATKLLPSEYAHRGISGEHTVIRFTDKTCVAENIFRIKANNVSISDMTIFGADGHVEGWSMLHGFTLSFSGWNFTIENVRMIKADLRDFNLKSDARLMCSNHIYIDKCSKNINIKNCEFHTKGCAIWVNKYEEGPRQFDLLDDSTQVKYVNVSNCKFYSYSHPYVHPDGRKPIADEGEISRGITMMNTANFTVEKCYFKGVDQENGFILCRSMVFVVSANCSYIANNELENVGCTALTKFGANTGEQILFHGGLHFSGVYNVLESNKNSLTVRTDNIRLKDDNGEFIRTDETLTNDGSRINEYLMRSTRGMAFICAGKGVGQVRQIISYDIKEDKIVFNLAEPWRIEPDKTSIVVETAPFRENIIYKNKIYKHKLTLEKGYKSGGVLFFFNSHSNIIAENEISNLSFGTVLNTADKSPATWNMIRDNIMSGIAEAYKDALQGGDTVRNATFFCESVIGNIRNTDSGGWDNYNVWYTVGNTFRNNKCSNGDTAAEIATNRWNYLLNTGLEDYYGEEKGNALTIIENNTFTDVADGLLLGNPAYWSLVRNNKCTYKEKEGYSARNIINDHPMTNFCLLHIIDDEIIDDKNNTANN